MADTVIIGRVGIHVVPDTSGFRKETEREVDRALKGTEGEVDVHPDMDAREFRKELKRVLRELAKDAELNIDLDVDSAYAAAKRFSKKLGDQLADDIEESFKNIDTGDVYGPQEEEFSKARRELDRMARTLEEFHATMIDVDGEADELRRTLEDIDVDVDVDGMLEDVEREIKQIEKDKINLSVEFAGLPEVERELIILRDKMDELATVVIDPHVSEEAKRKALHEMKQLEDKINDITASIHPDVAYASLKYAQFQLAKLTRSRIVSIIPKVSKPAALAAAKTLSALSGFRAYTDMLEDFKDIAKEFDRLVPKLAAMASGFVTMAAAILSGSANLFSLSKELAQIGPLALALPGILSGVIIALGVFVIALSDIKKVIPDVVAQWGALKKTISDNFWDKAAAPLRRVTKQIMPQLERGLARTATELGDFSGAFADAFGAELVNNNTLTQMFTDLSDSIKIGKGYVKDYARIIAVLGRQGAKMLPRLAKYIGQISERFANFLTKAENSGELQEWLDTAIERTRQLGEVFYEAGRFAASLARAANKAGGTTLGGLRDDLKSIADVTSSPAFQKQLVATLLAADEAMQNIADNSGPAFRRFFTETAKTFETVLPEVGNTVGTLLGAIFDGLGSESFQTGLTEFFRKLKAAVDRISPGLTTMAEALGPVLELAGSMADAFSPIVGKALETGARTLKELAPYLEDVVYALSGPLSGLLDDLSGPIDKIVKAAGPALKTVATAIGGMIDKLTPAIGHTADKLADFIVDGLNGIKPETMERIADALVRIATKGLEALEGLIDFISEAGKDKGSGNALDKLADGITAVADALDLLTDTTPEMSEAKNPFSKILTWMVNFGNGQIGDLKPEDIRAKIKGFFSTIGGAFKDGYNAIPTPNEIKAKIADFFKGLWDGIKAGPKNDASLKAIKEIGGKIIDGLVAGFEDAVHKVKEWLQKLTEKIPDWKGPAATDSELLRPAGRKIIAGLIQGFADKLADVKTWLTNLTTLIKDKFKDAATWLIGKGRSIITGLIAGMKERFADVRTRLQELKQSIVDKFSNAVTLLQGKGRSIVSGLIQGVKDRTGDLRARVSSLRGSISSAIGNTSRLLYSAGQNVSYGLADGIYSSIGTAVEAAHRLAQAVSSAAKSTKGLDVRSPSRVFRSIGEYVVKGLIVGMESMHTTLRRAALDVADIVSETEFATPEVKVGGIDTKKVAAKVTSAVRTVDQTGTGEQQTGAQIQVVNHYPQAEPTSVTINKAQQLAAVFGP